MLQPATLIFLEKLTKNNNKAWFDKNKAAYETAKADFESFVGALMQQMATIEPALRDQKPKDCIFRIYRDVRFAKDKTPYKSHFSAYFSKGGKKYEGAGYYIHIEPGKSFAAGGVWMPEAPVLKAIRQEIDYNLDEFEGILKAPAFKKLFKKISGDQLKTVPQGYEADNPAIEYLRMKSFIAQHPLADKDITAKNFVKKCTETFAAMKPLADFINRGIE